MNDSRPAPSRWIRLVWWFGIYIAAQLPLIPWIYQSGDPSIWFEFPMGVAWPVVLIVTGIANGLPLDTQSPNYFIVQILRDCCGIGPLVVPWVIYAAHLIFTLCVRKRRHFLILMWLLGAIVLFNLASCAWFLHAPPE